MINRSPYPACPIFFPFDHCRKVSRRMGRFCEKKKKITRRCTAEVIKIRSVGEQVKSRRFAASFSSRGKIDTRKPGRATFVVTHVRKRL